MATLKQCFDEMQARRARLAQAEKDGWRDCIPGEREKVSEFEFALNMLLQENAEMIVAAAGHLELGNLPLGISLSYGDHGIDPYVSTSKPAEPA